MPQIAWPTSDVSIGGWTTDAGGTTDLYQSIDESSSSDSDYVRSDLVSSPDTYIVGMRPFADPGVDTGHTIRLRQRKDSAAGDTTDLDVTLTAGTWPVRTETYDDIDETINAVTFTLTSEEVDDFRAHGGYADPRLQLVRRKRTGYTFTADIEYTTSPVSKLADLYRPDTGSGPWPVVISSPFSGFENADKGDPVTGPGVNAVRLAQEEGFAVLVVELRAAPTYLSPAAQIDHVAAVAWIVANAATYNLDANNIGTFGGSGGGTVAAYLGSKVLLPSGDKPRLKCVVQGSGPMDLPGFEADDFPDTADLATIEAWIGDTYVNDPTGWEEGSPYYQLSADFAAMFTAHSIDDDVPLAQAVRMHAGLTGLGVPNQLRTRAGGTHGTALLNTTEMWGAAMTWFHTYLD